MSKKNIKEEEYEFSVAATDAFRQYWPDSVTPTHPFFNRYMIECQLALIEAHRHTMFPSDKRRALQTVRYLKKCLSKGHYD